VRHERATEDIRERAALYALGLLTQGEARSFELHLRDDCPVCTEELRQFENVVAGIGLAAGETKPPEYFRDLLMTRIERDAAAPSQPQVAQEKAVVREHPPTRPSPSISGTIFSQTTKERPSFYLWIFAAGLVLLTLIFAYAWKLARDESAQLREKTSAARSDANTLRSLLDVQKERTGEFDQVISALGKPGTRILRITGLPPAPAISGVLIFDAKENQWLILGHFPPVPEGKIYQLWFVTPTSKISAEIIKTDPTGRAFVTGKISKEFVNMAGAVVTMEPEIGSPQPTLPDCAIAR
jgi:anti-sigma-K factor RskA